VRTIAFIVVGVSSVRNVAAASIIFREQLLCRGEHLDEVDWGFFHHVLHLLLRCLRKECTQMNEIAGR
jgi:hypothetical protein